MPTDKPRLPYAEAAERQTVWVCKTCRSQWQDTPQGEDFARRCCGEGAPCEKCGVPKPGRHYCEPCRKKRRDAQYAAMPRVDWDEETPLCTFDDDRYFFSAEEVCYYLDEHEGATLEDLQLVLCEPSEPPVFEMDDFLHDVLPEDRCAEGCADVEKAVNDYIRSRYPWSWYPTGTAVTVESLRAAGCDRCEED